MAGWFLAPPASDLIVPGWYPDAPAPTEVDGEPGWWAVVSLDTAMTVHWLSALDLIAVRGLGFQVTIAASRTLALQKLGMLAVSRGLTVNSALALQGRYLLNLSLNVALQRALAITRVAPVSLARVIDLTPTLALANLRPIDVPAAWSVFPVLGLSPIQMLNVSQALTVTRSFDLGRTLPVAMSQTIAASRAVSFGFPPTAEETVQYTGGSNQSGANYTHTIRRWCDFMDIVVVGAGGSGQASFAIFNYGQPGRPGEWATATVQRGPQVPWDMINFDITTGTGGGAIPYSAIPGAPGSDTVVTIPGVGTLTGQGGNGGIGWAGSQAATRGLAPSPQNLVYNGKTYAGGGPSTANSQPGKPPGGSGSGSPQLSGSQAGARGGAWVRSYQ